MQTNIADIKQLAAGLQEQMQSGLPDRVTHSSCLELLARAAGLENWQTYRAQQQRTWVYRQHEAFLPNAADTVKSLSTRKAVARDIAEFESEDVTAAWTNGLRRMFWQLNQVRHGALRVEFELTAALSAATSYPLEELAQRVQGGRRNVEEFLSDYGNKPMSVTNAERYQHLYLSWRLDTFSLAFAKLKNMPRNGQLLQLVDNHIDLFGYVALHRNGRLRVGGWRPSFDAIAAMAIDVRNEDPNLRYGSKSLLLEYATGSGKTFAALNPTVQLPQWKLNLDEGYELLDDIFPEIALWHAWIELKPLLADHADTFYAERMREVQALPTA